MALFVTGGTGFIGRRFLQNLDLNRLGPVHALVRGPARLPAGVQLVPGHLHDPDSYEARLAECDTVIHLASLTGKASFEKHRRVNTVGTRTLLEACLKAHVKRIIYVSTIAVDYPATEAYAYAQTKKEAEELVRASSLDYAIVRPTIVLGPGSPHGNRFRWLSTAPVMIILGKGRARINPVHVGDVASCLEWLAESEMRGGRTFGFGGRNVLTIEDFQRRIRWALTGKEGPELRMAIRPIVAVLSRLQKFLLPTLPVTAGQFYAFLYDSVPERDEGVVPALADRRGVDEIIAEQWPTEPPPPPAVEPLGDEAAVFCHYLIGREPSEYIRTKYVEAHTAGPNGPVLRRSFDDRLIAFARGGPGRTRFADAYAAVFSRHGTFRRKLVLLLAILESTREASALVDSPDATSTFRFVLGSIVRLAGVPILGISAALWFGPKHLGAAFRGYAPPEKKS
jgi:NADH dehydrogenase